MNQRPRGQPSPDISRQLRSQAKELVRRTQRFGARLLFSFGPDELEHGLRAVGLRRGDVVLVHSSYDAFRGFSGRPSDVISTLQRAVGADGGLLMPTMPFVGTATEWVRANPIVDLRRSPSRMGLITEVFRRSRDVVRSVHPTHPTAAWGSATNLLDSHASAATPCGERSPYHRLLDRNGRILLLGTGIECMTFFHTVEELLEDQLPQTPFTREIFSLKTVAPDGREYTTLSRLFEPAVSRRRNIAKILPSLEASALVRYARVGLLRIASVRAQDVLDVTASLAARRVYAYDDYPCLGDN